MNLYTRTITQELSNLGDDYDYSYSGRPVIYENKHNEVECMKRLTPMVNINLNVSVSTTDSLETTKNLLRELIQFAKTELNN